MVFYSLLSGVIVVREKRLEISFIWPKRLHSINLLSFELMRVGERKNATPPVTRDAPKRKGGGDTGQRAKESSWKSSYSMYLGRGPSPFGKDQRQSVTNTDPTPRDHRRAKKATSEDDRTGRGRVRATRGDDDRREGSKARRELDPWSTPRPFQMATAPRAVKGSRAGKCFLLSEIPNRKFFLQDGSKNL